MLIFKKTADLQAHLNSMRQAGKTIGFAPTMGALHAGHTSLITQAKTENDVVVCSIFVNPTQFNDKNDLAKYPRTTAADINILTSAICDVLFLPDETEVYPADFDYNFALDLGGLDLPMEGAKRPGHFKGVVQVVKRLLELVQPNTLYMGQKDFQQFAVCQRMIALTQLPIRIVRCPIIREPDGLAMSSRNVRLTTTGRAVSAKISAILFEAQERAKTQSLKTVEAFAVEAYTAIPEFDLDYFEICDAKTLQNIESFEDAAEVVACVVVKVDGVRLLDNVILK